MSAKLITLRIFYTFFLLIGIFHLQGQDLQFSQYYSAPLQLNPALTGGFGAKYRVSAIYRDQWRGPLERSISSFGASLDLRFDINSGALSGDAAGVGLQFITDQASPVDLSTNLIAVSGGFHKSLSRNQKKYISAGAQLVTGQRNILYENLVFQDQFDGVNSFSGVTGEDLPSNNFGFSDLAVGLNFVNTVSTDVQYYIGASLQHVLEPQFSFYKKDNDVNQQSKSDSRLKRKYTLHAGSTLRTSENLSISPRLLFVNQGESMRGLLGTVFIIEPNHTDAFNFHLGTWLTGVRDFEGGAKLDDIGFLVGMSMGDLFIGMSYDLNLRDIVKYTTGQGAFELSITYLGNYEDEGGACPTF
ncbi:MAG: PorP/SprF family type IX secretion system membrane protein [Saprospiraceae bacterium]|nr:PorP/SprF family type IX secretion system membrane protein [Saprospiraceae bacterium]